MYHIGEVSIVIYDRSEMYRRKMYNSALLSDLFQNATMLHKMPSKFEDQVRLYANTDVTFRKIISWNRMIFKTWSKRLLNRLKFL